MMAVFGAYARYYDLLYRDKDYAGEAQYVHNLIQRYVPGARSILELGCGTGAHAVLLVREGYSIHGVDLSTDMLERAEARLAEMPPEQASRLKFSPGDIRAVRINGSFDAVISLFDVISYQTTNEDLKAAFATAKAHLKPGGVFIFDCWYGPAVLSDRPAVRVKRVENEEIAVTRIAEPVLYPNDNCVDVNHQLLIKHKASGAIEELRECHRMRYLFMPEIKELFAGAELEMVASYAWMTDREPGFDAWNVCFVGRRS
jgi:SAM-dependent methyltransferase